MSMQSDEVYEFIGRVLDEAIHLEEKNEKPNAVCMSAKMYKALEDDFKAKFMQLLPRGVKTEPKLYGMRVYIADGLQDEEFLIGKLRTKTD